MKRERNAYVLLTAVLLFACTDKPSSDNGRASAEADIAAALGVISRENIEAHLQFLAADERNGRLTGSPGYDESAKYVAEQFEAIGLEQGGSDGWLQPVPLISWLLDVEKSSVTVHKGKKDIDLTWGKDAIFYADRVRDSNKIRGEVVFAGFGVHAPELGYSDYENIDVSGKIVAFFSNAPASFSSTERAYYSSGRSKEMELMKRGAIGQIGLISRLAEEGYSWEDRTENLRAWPGASWISEAGEIADYHPELQGDALFNVDSAELLFENAPITFEEARDAAEQNRPLSSALGVEVTMRRGASHEHFQSPNVIGILRGSDPDLADEYVVYSTHLDHLGSDDSLDGDGIYNGMYDNALGVAVTIEVARALSSMSESPRRSIIFAAVTGEESGLLGSDFFAHYPTVPASSIVANVNIDMPLMLFPMDTVVGYGAQHSSLQEVTASEAIKEGFELTPDPYPEENYFRRSDQYSFVRQGIPSVYFAEGIGSSDATIDGRAVQVTFTNDHYHQPSDDLSRPIEWETMLRFARAGTRIGYRIAMDDERPTWNEGDFFGEKFGR